MKLRDNPVAVVAAMLLSASAAVAAEPVCKLAWDPSPDPTVTGTILYYGTNSRSYFSSNSYPAGVTNAAVSNLTVGVVYYFTVTAVNQYGVESEYSNEVVLTNALPDTSSETGGETSVADGTTDTGGETGGTLTGETGVDTSATNQTLVLTGGPVYYLAWDPSPDPTVTGSILYYGTNSGIYFASNSYPASVTNVAISNLTCNAVYYLTVTAVNQYGVESEYSNEVLLTNFVAQPPPPLPDPGDTSGTNAVVDAGGGTGGDTGSTGTGGTGGDTGTTPGDTLSSTNVEAFVAGMPPALHMGITNGNMRFTILGTLGASMALETSTSLSPYATWSTVTNLDFVTPAPAGTNSGGGGEIPARLAEAFTPAVAQVEIPVVQVGSLSFTRVTMPYSYPVLADHTLRQKGYQTYLIVVRLPGVDGRDVCYVAQDQAYIDFDGSANTARLATSGGTIREIATRLADSLGMNWTSASQFLYTEAGEEIVATVVKTEDPASDPALITASAGGAAPQSKRIDF